MFSLVFIKKYIISWEIKQKPSLNSSPLGRPKSENDFLKITIKIKKKNLNLWIKTIKKIISIHWTYPINI